MDKEKCLRKIELKYIFFALITIVFLDVNQNLATEEIIAQGNILKIILHSIKGNNIAYCLYMPILSIFYSHVGNLHESCEFKQKLYAIAPAVLFALFMVFGYSFYVGDNLELITNSKSGQPIKSLLLGVGYSVLFYNVITFFYYILDANPLIKKKKDLVNSLEQIWIIRKYEAFLHRNVFMTVFFTLIIAYIPYIILSYPTIFFEDAHTQIIQAYQELGYVEPMYLKHHLLSQDVLLNNHHPIVHTLLMHFFIELGNKVFHSINIGIFLFSIIQFLILIFVIAYTAKILFIHYQVKESYIFAMVLYYVFSPRIQNYMFVVTKDIYYSIFVILFINFCCALLDEKNDCVNFWGFVLSSVGIILFRNEGKYVVIVTYFMIAILNKETRKRIMRYTVGVTIFCIIFSQILLACKITPGGKREMLSVPLQQTARYIRDYGDEVTEEEREAIGDVIHYSKLGDDYNPDVSDNAKWTFRDYATKEELLAYAEAWLSMFLKHPGVYVQATMNNYYAYFYSEGQPFEGCTYELSQECMDIINNKLLPLEIEFSYPKTLQATRQRYEECRENFARLPIISLLMMPETYTWLLILLVFYSIRCKNKRALSLLVMPCVILAICLVGPCNGYYCRYLYPIMMCLPMIIPRLDYFIVKEEWKTE